MSRTVTVPDWLNESFLQTVLQQNAYQGKEVKINNVEVTPAVPHGTNYGSDLFRIRGKYQEEANSDQVKEISVLVKDLAIDKYIGKYLEKDGIIAKEYIVYSEFLPEVYKLLPKSERFTAELLYSPEPQTLVLEDLKHQGFIMADRLKQLDFDHCLVCMKTLAKFHAAGVAVIKNNPEFIMTIGREPMYDKQNTEMREQTREMTESVMINFTKAVRNWDGFEEFEEKSRRVWETQMDDVYAVFEPRKDSLNVLNHGDLWLNNMMFKYDSDGNIVDFRLVDFQMCRYTSPVTDLLYFLYSSGNQEVRENRLDELLSVYLKTLNSVLEQLGCEVKLTRDQLNTELKRSDCYIFAISYTILPVVLSDPDDLVNLDEVTKDNSVSKENNPFEKCYYGKYYKVIASQILRYLYKAEFFERSRPLNNNN